MLALIITPRLDYCNSVFAGLPQSTLEPLQIMQNASARLVSHLAMSDATKSVAAGFGRHGMPPPASNDTATALGQDGSD